MSEAVFASDQITNAKRVVRALHYEYAEKILVSRSLDFQSKFNCLILPGRGASEEISTLREAIPRAQIFAIDRDPEAVEAARAGGADFTLEGELFSWETRTSGIPTILSQFGKMDLVNLDLCNNITTDLAVAVRRFINTALKPRSVVIVTVSYGRDAASAFERIADPDFLEGEELSLADKGRIMVLIPKNCYVRSVLVYKGNKMPMMSILIEKGEHRLVRYSHRLNDLIKDLGPAKIVRVLDEDLRKSVLSETLHNPANLYCVPAARVAAWRATRTRMQSGEEETTWMDRAIAAEAKIGRLQKILNQIKKSIREAKMDSESAPII